MFDRRPETKDNACFIAFTTDNGYGLVGTDAKSGITDLTIIRIAWNLLDYRTRHLANGMLKFMFDQMRKKLAVCQQP